MSLLFRQVFLPLIGALIWGFAFLFQKGNTMGVFLFDAFRSLVAVLFLVIWILIREKGNVKRIFTTGNREETKTLLIGGLIAGVLLTFAMWTQQTGITRGTDIGKAGFLTTLYVVLVPVFSLFFRKETPFLTWIGVAIALVGTYFLSVKRDSGFSIAPEDLYVLVSAVLYALQIIVIGIFVTKTDPVKLTALEFLVSAVLSFIFGFATETFEFGALRESLVPILYLGIVSSGIGYTIQTAAEKGTNASVVTLFMSMESVVSVLTGALILGERMTGREILGASLMFFAVVLNSIGPLFGRKRDIEK